MGKDTSLISAPASFKDLIDSLNFKTKSAGAFSSLSINSLIKPIFKFFKFDLFSI